MGMYNEVFYTCPECKGRGYMQISQLVLGFGEFDLENYDTLRDLDFDDLLELKARVLYDNFICDDCGHVFNPYNKDRESLISKLFDVEISDDEQAIKEGDI
jgi:rubredoxin